LVFTYEGATNIQPEQREKGEREKKKEDQNKVLYIQGRDYFLRN